MTIEVLGKPIPGHPNYRVTDDMHVFGPRGELRPNLVRGGYPTISTSNPKTTVYLALATALVYLGEPLDDEELIYLDGDPKNWRLDNLLYACDDTYPVGMSRELELEFCRILDERKQIERLMQPPPWYRKRKPIRDLGPGPIRDEGQYAPYLDGPT
ncbi:hypothetical protein [Mycobacterium shigaense]|uniref:hypothetical protein n=1 Tax=Mycobacterium shigaense TaxID=722731 RepID=UPI002AE0691A|nr:hypothetical protein [Mycobacterium shigaense]MEA1121707.1 hypothetical protein [Mycobacterium shigaense]